jgi:hypothetical protein
MWSSIKANIIRQFVVPAGQLLLDDRSVATQQLQTLRYLLSKSQNTHLDSILISGNCFNSRIMNGLKPTKRLFRFFITAPSSPGGNK